MKTIQNKKRPVDTVRIPGMTFGERTALAHYARQAGIAPAKMVRECVNEMAPQIASLNVNKGR